MTRTDHDLPGLMLVGPPGHGVVAYAQDVAEAVNGSGAPARVISTSTLDEVIPLATTMPRIHVHVTDRILGSSPEKAADLVDEIGRTTSLTITLHDLPQPSDGSNFARRREAYSRFMDAASGVVVNSHHEAQLVNDFLRPSTTSLAVIELGTRPGSPPVASRQHSSPPGPGENPLPLRVLLAGFVYPGKGHKEAIEAVGSIVARAKADSVTPSESSVVALGAPSAGHERDVDTLREYAAERGVEFSVTGFLEDEQYWAAMAGPGIPLAAHQHVSASRSMLDWIERGRRPLVIDSSYAREMDRLRPGTMTLFAPAELADRLEQAWRDPSSTFLSPDTSLAPTLLDTATAYRKWWAGADL